MAYEMASSFRGVPFGGPRVEILQGAPYGMTVLSHFAPKVNRIIATHVEQVALASSPAQRPISSRSKVMRAALDILSDVSGPKWRHQVSEKNPNSVLSFSLRPPEVIDRAYERYVTTSPSNLIVQSDSIALGGFTHASLLKRELGVLELRGEKSMSNPMYHTLIALYLYNTYTRSRRFCRPWRSLGLR